MKKIALTQGKFALVDDKDFEWLNQWKWCYDGGYAKRGIWDKDKRRVRQQFMARLVMGNPDGFVDHVSGNTLDNTRINLRVVSPIENAINRKTRVDNKSGQKGVHYRWQYGLWQARISRGGIRVSLGHFKTKEEAIRAYLQAVPQWLGEYARTII